MLKQTPLHAAHVALRAKMAEFAGYDMPIQYADGVMAEHNWTRAHAGLFDVSHMGQIWLSGAGAIPLLERLTPASVATMRLGSAKYSVLMNEQGGMIDDLIITRVNDNDFYLVVNGACKDKDVAWIRAHLLAGVRFDYLQDRGLLALQGPDAEQALREALGIDAAALDYMHFMTHGDLYIARLGYTGEDGFEISMPVVRAADIWERLSAHPSVRPVGLAARDSLRLDMGYPLYGHDIDAATSPLEADLAWIVRKDNHDFIGSDKLAGPRRKRVGIRLTDKGVAREGCALFNADGAAIGVLTSGGYSPTLNASIGMGYVDSGHTVPGTAIHVDVRGRRIAAEIAALPFIQPKTKARKKHAA